MRFWTVAGRLLKVRAGSVGRDKNPLWMERRFKERDAAAWNHDYRSVLEYGETGALAYPHTREHWK